MIKYICADGLNMKEIEFSCLSTLLRTVEVSIEGSQNTTLHRTMIEDILSNTKCLLQISFSKVHIEGREINASLGAGLQKLIRNANHVREWCFNKVITDGEPFQLPSDIRILQCKHTNWVSFKHNANITLLRSLKN